MAKLTKYQYGIQYSELVKNAVRYGYLYRKEAEKDLSSHACIDGIPDILQWLASLIVNGIAWDIIRSVSKKLYRKIKRDDTQLDAESKRVLNDEGQLYIFVIYIKEFIARQMSLNDKQLKYIKEEIVADVVGKELGEIISKEGREPTIQEIMDANVKARKNADCIVGRQAMQFETASQNYRR